MKTLVTAFVLVMAFILTAGTASAGLHFADSFTTGPGSTPTTTMMINATGGIYDPVGSVDINGSAITNTSVLDVNWTTGTANMDSGGTTVADLVIWFGSVTSPGLVLSAVSVSEDGTNFLQQTFGAFIDATTYSNRPYRVFFDDATVLPSQRDKVIVARITFSFNNVSTINVDGVSTPEPGTFALFGLGLLGLGGAMWRRRKKKA